MSLRRGVHRDRWGIPHVVGDDLLDVARLHGSAAAAYRTWQLEHARLKAEGRTASLVGAAGLPWDTFARRARLTSLARR